MVLVTDEIRSYVIFNYAHINWTSSRESGSISGRGGYQSAIAGFNGGNATGFTPLPYSGQGDIYKLSKYSSGGVPGRWVYRVDEEIIFGGCSNASAGVMTIAPNRVTMLGGLAVNVSGPCLKLSDVVTVLFDEFPVPCQVLNIHRARCILPKFHKVGLINARMSRDSGASYPYITTFFIVPPDRAAPGVILRKNVLDYLTDAFDNPTPDQLTLTWSPHNLTSNQNAKINVELWGYWEDNEKHIFQKVATLAENLINNGHYSFNPKALARIHDPALMKDAFKRFEFGNLRVSVQNANDGG
uniref:NIDO domain-containing protein n=1 Tax=Romanomermis culicivorax TaxID=13658 RepID=A0A915J1N2_ROMCU